MTGLVEVAGFAILGGALAEASVNAYRSFRDGRVDLQRRQAELALFRERAHVELEATQIERQRRELAWEGLRKFYIERKVHETDSISSFYLKPYDREAIPPFLPGQYLTFQLRIPGQAKPVTRCYSLSDTPLHRDYYRVTIKRLPPPPDEPGAPPGLASGFFHGLSEGDLVDVRAPAGHFYLDAPSDRPVVLIAGGVGITPLLSMLNTICGSGARRETWLFYGVRNRRDHMMRDYLREVAREFENVRVVICYSQPDTEAAQGEDFDESVSPSVELLKRLLPSNNYQFYICGPPPMMGALVKDLRAWDVPEPDIRYEAFGSATVKRSAAPAGEQQAAGESFAVTFARSGKSATWNAQAGVLLDLAEKCNVQIDSGCRAGNCGSCVTAIRTGEIRYLIEPGYRPKDGTCLPCVAVPKTAVALDA